MRETMTASNGSAYKQVTSTVASTLYVGVMSGTSADGVDAVLVDFAAGDWQVLGHAQLAFDDTLSTVRDEILSLNCPDGQNELHRSAVLANTLARLYAQTVQRVLTSTGVPAHAVRAVGIHGQTVRHQPLLVETTTNTHASAAPSDDTGYTLQLNNPALVAEKTHIDTIADFRSRDIAAGGQGAPLAPLFHQAWLQQSTKTQNACTAILNLGGIANVTLLDAQHNILYGFDTGPANVLMDAWTQQHLHRPYDESGAWAARGTVHPQLLERMLTEPFFTAPTPKSTGRDLFNTAWLTHHLQQVNGSTNPHATHATTTSIKAEDVQATLLELTARSLSMALASCQMPAPLGRLLLCGGGAYNTTLRLRLAELLPTTQVSATDDYGLPAQQVEAMAFAWLAKMCIERQPLPLARVTGATGARILGAQYPA